MNDMKGILVAKKAESAKSFANLHSLGQKERNEMKKLMIVMAMAFVAAFAFAQDVETVKVRGRGTGTDKTEALKDAYRDAVEQAVGLYVDAEQMVKNEELVKDQILTHSNAYIEKYEVAKEGVSANGLVTVTILADVRQRALTKKIRDVMPLCKIDLSGVSRNLHARILTDFKANDDALTIIKNELDGLQPLKQLMNVTLGSSNPIVEPVKEDASLVRLWYPIKVEVDARKYYQEFAPRWSRILDQITVSPATRLNLKNNSTYVKAYNDAVVEKFGKTRKNRVGIMTRCEEPNSRDWPSSGMLEEWGLALNEEYQGETFLDIRILSKEYVLHGLYDTAYCIKSSCAGERALSSKPSRVRSSSVERVFSTGFSRHELQKQIDGGCNFSIGLVSAANGNTLSGNLYKIPQKCIDEIVKWQHRIVCNTDEGYKYRETAPEVEFSLMFADENGEEVLAQIFSLRNFEVMNFGCALLEDTEYSNGERIGGTRLWLITPLVGGFAKSYVKWISVDIPQDDVAKIASAIIKPVEE